MGRLLICHWITKLLRKSAEQTCESAADAEQKSAPNNGGRSHRALSDSVGSNVFRLPVFAGCISSFLEKRCIREIVSRTCSKFGGTLSLRYPTDARFLDHALRLFAKRQEQGRVDT